MAKSKSKPRPTVAALERSPSHLLHRALQLALDLYAAEFGGAGLTQRQFAVLAAVADHEGATQTDLVRLTGIDRSTLADMAARMIAKGLLERQRSLSDARANAVSLTDAGRAALESGGDPATKADEKLLALLSPKKRETFLKILGDLAQAADEAKTGKPTKAAKPDKPKKRKKKKAAKKAAAKEDA